MFLMLVAMSIDLYAGDWVKTSNRSWHPTSFLEGSIGRLTSKLIRVGRADKTLSIRGSVTTFIVLGICGTAGILIHHLSGNTPLFWAVELWLVLALIDIRRTWQNALLLANGMERDGLPGARLLLPTLSDRDPFYADVHEVARTAIESIAFLFVFRVIGPVLSYLLLGLGGLYGYYTLYLLHKDAKNSEPFHRVGEWMYSALHRLFSVLGGLVLLMAALTILEVRSYDALTKYCHHLRWARGSGNKSTVAVMAGGLGLSLGGPRTYVTGIVAHPWVGEGKANADAGDICVAAKLFLRGCLIVYCFVAICVVLF